MRGRGSPRITTLGHLPRRRSRLGAWTTDAPGMGRKRMEYQRQKYHATCEK
jgi:hypothetical protein